MKTQSLGVILEFGKVRQVVCPKFGASLDRTMTTKPSRAIKQGLVSKQNKTKQPILNENRLKSYFHLSRMFYWTVQIALRETGIEIGTRD